MHKHLKAIHNIVLIKRKNISDDSKLSSSSLENNSVRSSTITQYLYDAVDNSLKCVLARFAASDRISFSVILLI